MFSFLFVSAFFLTQVDETKTAQKELGYEELLLQEAPKAWEKYSMRAKRLQGSWSNILLIGKTKKKHSEDHLELKQSPGCTLSLQQTVGSTNSGNLRVENSRYAFTLQRSSPEGPWAVTGWGKNLWKPSTINDPKYSVDLVTRLPYTFGSVVYTLPITVLDPGFSLKKVVPFPKDGRQLFKVEFTYWPPDNSPKKPLRAGWVLFDPDHYWIIRQFEVKSDWGGADSTQICTFEYKEGTDGFPILKKLSRKQIIPSRNFDGEHRYEFDLQEGEVPESDFTLSAFGFPEPKGVTWAKPTPYYLWFMVVGFVCVVSGAFLRHWLRKKKATSSDMPRSLTKGVSSCP